MGLSQGLELAIVGGGVGISRMDESRPRGAAFRCSAVDPATIGRWRRPIRPLWPSSRVCRREWEAMIVLREA
jgi:hypothetical protein